MKTFRTYDLALKFYDNCQKLKLKDPIKDQFDRATLSVVLNLAEGSAKRTAADRRKSYYNAFGSLRETQALLQIIKHKPLIDEADNLGGHLYKLMNNPGKNSFDSK